MKNSIVILLILIVALSQAQDVKVIQNESAKSAFNDPYRLSTCKSGLQILLFRSIDSQFAFGKLKVETEPTKITWILAAKDTAGEVLWLNTFYCSNDTSECHYMEIDENENIYVGGTSNQGKLIINDVERSKGEGNYLIKISSAGIVNDVFFIAETNKLKVNAISFDEVNNLYAIASLLPAEDSLNNVITIGKPGHAVKIQRKGTQNEALLFSLNSSDYTLNWHKNIFSDSIITVNRIAYGQGRISIVGHYKASFAIDTFMMVKSTLNESFFLSTLSTLGEVLYTKEIAKCDPYPAIFPFSNHHSSPFNMIVGSSGAIYLTASPRTPVRFINSAGSFLSPTKNNSYILKFNAEGQLLWSKSLTNVCSAELYEPIFFSYLDMHIDLDKKENIYCGFKLSTCLPDKKAAFDTLKINYITGQDTYSGIIKLDSSGNGLWYKILTSDKDAGSGAIPTIAIDKRKDFRIYVAGRFYPRNKLHMPTTITHTSTYNTASNSYFAVIDTQAISKPIDTTSISSGLYKSLAIYPNPANNQLTVKLGIAKFKSIKLLNLQGQEIVSFSIEKAQGGDFNLNTSQLAEGMYILIAEGERETVQQKVVIKHE